MLATKTSDGVQEEAVGLDDPDNLLLGDNGDAVLDTDGRDSAAATTVDEGRGGDLANLRLQQSNAHTGDGGVEAVGH